MKFCFLIIPLCLSGIALASESGNTTILPHYADSGENLNTNKRKQRREARRKERRKERREKRRDQRRKERRNNRSQHIEPPTVEMPDPVTAPIPKIEPPEPVPNLAPSILSVSHGCDMATELLAVDIGFTATFFLLVDDEAPNELNYTATTPDSSLATVSVDSDGLLSVVGSRAGVANIPVSVSDGEGLTDSVEVKVLFR